MKCDCCFCLYFTKLGCNPAELQLTVRTAARRVYADKQAADMLAKNPDFHLEIVTAFTSNFCDNRANVTCSLAASRATFAFNLGENLRRVCLVISFGKNCGFFNYPSGPEFREYYTLCQSKKIVINHLFLLPLLC